MFLEEIEQNTSTRKEFCMAFMQLFREANARAGTHQAPPTTHADEVLLCKYLYTETNKYEKLLHPAEC